MKFLRLTLASVAATAAAASLGAQVLKYPSAEYWSKPEVIQAFLNTYNVLTPADPKLSQDEQVVFKKIVEQLPLPNGHKLAIQIIVNHLAVPANVNCSAAFEFTLANLYAEEGDLDRAIEFYRKAAKKHDGFVRAYKNLGVFLCQKAEFELAIPELVKALNLGSSDSVTYGLLGLCYLNTGKLLAAESAYRSAIVSDPVTSDWRLGLARALLEQRKYGECITLLDELIKAKPDDASLWLAQANAYLGMDEIKKAAANYEVLRRMGKANAESIMLLGDIYMNENLRDLALDLYLEAIKIDPKQPVDRLVRAAEILIARGALDHAQRLLDEIHNTYPKLEGRDELQVLKLESRIAISTDDTERAAVILEKIIDREPRDGEALLLLASHYDRKDDVERASIYYERAAKIRDFEADALVAYAQMLVGKGKFLDAIPKLERAQTIRPRENVGRYLQQVRNAAQTAAAN